MAVLLKHSPSTLHQVKALTQKVATLTTSNDHYKSHSQSLEASLSNANKQIAALQQDVIVARQDAERNGANGRQLDRARTELEAELRAAKERLRELERQERDTSDVARRTEDAVKSIAEQKVAGFFAFGAHCILCLTICLPGET